MLNVPSHLLQPLYIDTNIHYNLDMSKFPGLDDPQHMYQPALLIATDWSDYDYDSQKNVAHELQTVDNFLEDNASFLSDLDQAHFEDTMSSKAIDPATFQFLIDDVIDTDISSHMFGVEDTCDLHDISIQDIQGTVEHLDNSVLISDILDHLCHDDMQLTGSSDNDPPSSKGKKRQRTYDTDHHHTKKPKTEHTSTSILSTYISWQRSSNNCIMACRDS